MAGMLGLDYGEQCVAIGLLFLLLETFRVRAGFDVDTNYFAFH